MKQKQDQNLAFLGILIQDFMQFFAVNPLLLLFFFFIASSKWLIGN